MIIVGEEAQVEGRFDLFGDSANLYVAGPTSSPTQPMAGPLTRARARQLNLQVSSVLNSCQSYLDNGDTCTFVLLGNNGQDQQGKVQLHSEFEATPTSRADCIWEE